MLKYLIFKINWKFYVPIWKKFKVGFPEYVQDFFNSAVIENLKNKNW